MSKLNVIAIGGNALVGSGTLTTVQSQIEAIEEAMVPLASLIAQGEKVVLVHGNGPQVGYMAMRSQLSREEIHEVPLDALVASSQGSMGYMIQRALREALKQRNVEKAVMTVVTEVEVRQRSMPRACAGYVLGPIPAELTVVHFEALDAAANWQGRLA